jgi:hypothetical protein
MFVRALVLLPVLVLGVFFASKVTLQTGGVEAMPTDSLYREVLNDAFGPGEYLRFSVGYGFVNAGDATLEVRDTNTYNGHLCYQIYSETTSNSFFDGFYRVRDTIVSQIDVDGIFSHYFHKALHEGAYHSVREIIFQHDLQRAITRRGADDIDTVEIGSFAQDVLSAMYYVRTQQLEVGKVLKVNSVERHDSQELAVRVLKKETVEVPAGVFDCIVVEPLLTDAGIFKQEGEVKVWLTDDRLKMPVLMKSKVLVGSIHAELEEFRLGDLNW